MTPQEKAKSLVDKIYEKRFYVDYSSDKELSSASDIFAESLCLKGQEQYNNWYYRYAIEAAIISFDEILTTGPLELALGGTIDQYYQDVRFELEKLKQ